MGQAQGTDGRLLADRYRLGEVLGKGGMGTVWRAEDETLGRTVAVKELRFPGNVDEDEKRRLITRTLREAKATARIRGTGAVTVFDVVEEDDRPWIVMELVEGRSLSDAIREDGPLTPQRAAEVGLVVLDVLKAAHKEGILHRDVKPSNVLIADDGRVVLSDFGIAQIDGDPSVTSTGMLVGAPSYISPERARGQKPGPPADLWSLGALLYASVEGRPPYDKGSAIATLTAVMTEPVGPMENAGPLADAINGLLIKDPAERLDDAGVRTLLTRVVDAPLRPVAPASEDLGNSATRVVTLPPDPQPTPTDAPPAARKAAADQARVRNALRSMRGAAAAAGSATAATAAKAAKAAKPRPAAEPGEPDTGPKAPRAPITDVVPRRVLIIAAIAVALAVLGTVIGFALANAGDGDQTPDSKPGATSSTPGKVGDGKASPTPSKGSTGTPSGPASSNPGGTGGTSTGTSAGTSSGTSGNPPAGTGNNVPAGYRVVTAGHFSIALPAGWHQTGSAGKDSLIFSADGGFPRVQIDFTDQPGKDAAAAWYDIEPSVGSSSSGYRLLGIEKVDFNGYRTAADWNFLRTEKGGLKARVLNRGFVVNDHQGFAIMFSAPADQWDSAAIQQMRETFFNTFKPGN
ncbi:serine/threonine-protein kinase [Streptomyces sp. SPB162]|uniref:serine/threonine-protein kinase n=1 Tax=Streptomyces sp. SPB162 TaxID=2940560 RepID=UPI0024051920|nr:serine/threonine-protein kinase [Streptomyces sp. SPB162]MDF9815102.1 tRNA A-37 threonylcarbamoyl transferase component Bud32 [Streptomyces sp. SPB162]